MTMNMWGEGCCGWNCRAEGLEEEQKRRFMDGVTEDRKLVGVRKEDAGDERVQWKQTIG